MIAEALKFIHENADKANPTRRIVKTDAEPKGIYYVANPDGSMTRVEAAKPPVAHKAFDLSTLTEWLKAGAIWYSRAAVIGSARPGDDRTDCCTLSLAPSKQLAYLMKVDVTPADLTQGDIIRTLRTTMFGSFNGDVLSNLRKVNLSKAKTVTSEQQRGKVSLSRQDMAEMSGAAAVPEVISFDIPVFANGSLSARAIVNCDLDINAESERFTLTVLPNEIEKAWTTGENWLYAALVELIGKRSVPLYYGTPN